MNKPFFWLFCQKMKRLFCLMVGERGFYVAYELFERLATFRVRGVPSSQHGVGNGLVGKRLRFGLNIAGTITAEGGVSEGVRATILATRAAAVPYALNNFSMSRSPNTDEAYADQCVDDNVYDINLVHINANKLWRFLNHAGPDYLKGKYNIGFWSWELSVFPNKWQDRFSYFHEIWTPSSFCLEALAPVSPVKVFKMPYAVEAGASPKCSRRHFGISDEKFVFLFLFDFYSAFERKNPLAVVNAFKRAFSPHEPVSLVVKFYNAEMNPRDHGRLRKAATGSSVTLLDGYLPRDETHDLLACCDAYVSLHRAEGFGFTMAEAMALGKPVIATNYSGNTEFMNSDNSFLVSYRLKELERDFGLYEKGHVWADPDVDDAARWMRHVYDKREAAQEVGRRAADYIRTAHAPSSVGRLIEARLREIGKGLGASGEASEASRPAAPACDDPVPVGLQGRL
ncbi:MAG: glycosyltransferase family 4 protein [Nitrospirae bacterium]|nr:glycosyltransferase family 4 protein [Nitrospirota bacterium]